MVGYKMKNKYHILFLLFFVFSLSISAQNSTPKDPYGLLKVDPSAPKSDIPEKPEASEETARDTQRPVSHKRPNFENRRDSSVLENESRNQEKTLVFLEKTDAILFDQRRLPGVQLLKGNVCLRHKDAFLYCDSAYFYSKANAFTAFSNVRLEQGDSLVVYGDILYYDGNTSQARLRNNVKMISLSNDSAVLTTDSLNYDRIRNVGYYFNGGQITSGQNILQSEFGYFYPDIDMAVFQKQVDARNISSVMKSDTLHYNTKTHISSILGPTEIVYKDSSIIYSEYGWYNMDNGRAQLMRNASVKQLNGRQLFGDTIYYDSQKQLGKGFSNVIISDTVNKIQLKGNYGYFQNENQLGIVTDSALMIQYSEVDTAYMHADSLFTFGDSIYNVALAYNNVRMFRKDVQATCDSLIYSSRDSVLHLLSTPYLFTDSMQLAGDTIRCYPKNGKIDYMHVKNNAFSTHEIDDEKFDQLSGKELFAYLRENKIYKIQVRGNAESIFFPQDNGRIIGMTQTQSSYLDMFFKLGKIHHFALRPSPQFVMYPLDKVDKMSMYLMNYTWHPELRPLKWQDVFLNPEPNTLNFKNALREVEREKERKARDLERKRRREERLKGNNSTKKEKKDTSKSPFDKNNENGFLN